MGRPLKEGLDYFPHDTDAVNDEKIEAMRAMFGAEGYAFYFISLERIYRTKNGQLDIGSKERRAFLAGRIGVSDERFMEMLTASFEIDLFDRKAFEGKGLMTSKGIKRRTQQVNKERARKRGRKSRALEPVKTDGSSEVLDGDNPGKSAQRKAKQRKEKIPPISPKGEAYSADFLTFWEAYPKKVGKGAAWKAFQKVRPEGPLLDLMLKAVGDQRATAAWTREGGQYIPNPATWLNQRRWEDEIEERTRDDDEGII